jgi:hypothetical protein
LSVPDLKSTADPSLSREGPILLQRRSHLRIATRLGVLALVLALISPASPALGHSGNHVSRDCLTWMESVSWLYWWDHAWTGGDYVLSYHFFKDVQRDFASSGVHSPGARRLIAGHNHSWFGQDYTEGFHHVHAHGIHYTLFTRNAGCV